MDILVTSSILSNNSMGRGGQQKQFKFPGVASSPFLYSGLYQPSAGPSQFKRLGNWVNSWGAKHSNPHLESGSAWKGPAGNGPVGSTSGLILSWGGLLCLRLIDGGIHLSLWGCHRCSSDRKGLQAKAAPDAFLYWLLIRMFMPHFALPFDHV